MKNIKDTLNFVSFLQKSASIVRLTPATKNRDHLETDAEHCFQLAMVCWYLIEKYNLNLNTEKTLKYALSHDLVEIHAGDLDPFNSTEDLNSQTIREQKALDKIKTEWDDFEELGETIEEFEKRDNPESSFVHMIDKTLPVMNTYLTQYDFYINKKITFSSWSDWLDGQLNSVGDNLPREVNSMILELREFLNENGSFVFATD